MKRYLLNLLATISLIAMNSCSNGQGQYNLSPLDFSKKIKELPSASLVDVRTPNEYAHGHLQNAMNIDWRGDSFDQQISNLDKAKPVLVYCLSGGRSSSAATHLRELGYTQVYELQGGISQWRNAGLSETTDIKKVSQGMNLEQYRALLKTDQLVLINFYAPWCAPCKQMEPYLKELKSEMQGKVLLLRLDADENQVLFKELQLASIPMLLLYKRGSLVWSKEGFVDKREVMSHLESK